MSTLGVYVQRPPQVRALQYDGSAEAAAWIVERFGGGAAVIDGVLMVGPPGMQEELPVGEWIGVDPAGQVSGRWSDETFAATWEYVEDAPAEQQPTE